MTSTLAPRRTGKIRAFLAGGLVLGLGAAITLAAWNDSEFATGDFTAGAFNLEGAVVAGTFTEHATAATAGELVFTLDAGNLAPGDAVYAPFAVRLDATTTRDAVVTVSSEATSGVITGLTYELVSPSTFGCAQATAGVSLVTAGTPIGTVPGAPTFDLDQGSGGAAGAPVNLCFKVSADDGLVEGQNGTVTWEFAAASV